MEHGADEDGERVRFLVRDNFREVEILCAEKTARPWTVVLLAALAGVVAAAAGTLALRRRRPARATPAAA